MLLKHIYTVTGGIRKYSSKSTELAMEFSSLTSNLRSNAGSDKCFFVLQFLYLKKIKTE